MSCAGDPSAEACEGVEDLIAPRTKAPCRPTGWHPGPSPVGTIRTQPHLPEPRTSRIAPVSTEVRSGETGNLTGTVSALTELLFLTGSHCEAPPIARCCRTGGNGSTAVDGLR
ncbi:hypothetical protein GCM10010320_10490 [Streptomyces caelestis]|nr:hypothetical protein GCM10010320_10490 [Streptomyces caelestis]